MINSQNSENGSAAPRRKVRSQRQPSMPQSGTGLPVLCVGYTVRPLEQRQVLLSHAGYEVSIASSHALALKILRRKPFAAVVIGHTVPETERMDIISAARRQNPDAIVVLLYWDSIRRTEAADAILCIGNGPMSLVQAMRELLGH